MRMCAVNETCSVSEYGTCLSQQVLGEEQPRAAAGGCWRCWVSVIGGAMHGLIRVPPVHAQLRQTAALHFFKGTLVCVHVCEREGELLLHA